MSCFFKGTTPCKDCPYRKDAPLQKWDKAEFSDLLEKDMDFMGALYNCHKKDGSVCKGWLIDQDKRNFPSIMLRIKLSREGITREYLDKLNSNAPLYPSIRAMIKANYPELLK
jgi:hypothetical protein